MTPEGKAFLQTAKHMREAQNAYFKFRDGNSLKAARKLEKQFDEQLENLLNEKPAQQKLKL